jgi:hypothetical protein
MKWTIIFTMNQKLILIKNRKELISRTLFKNAKRAYSSYLFQKDKSKGSSLMIWSSPSSATFAMKSK